MLVACGNDGGKDNDEKALQSDWEKLIEKGKLVVATSGTLYPTSFHSKEEELTGFEVEIIREVAKRLELDLEFSEMGLDGMFTSLNSGQVDLAVNDIEDY